MRQNEEKSRVMVGICLENITKYSLEERMLTLWVSEPIEVGLLIHDVTVLTGVSTDGLIQHVKVHREIKQSVRLSSL